MPANIISGVILATDGGWSAISLSPEESARPPAPGILEVTINERADLEQVWADATKEISPAAKYHGTRTLLTPITKTHCIARARTGVRTGLVRHRSGGKCRWCSSIAEQPYPTRQVVGESGWRRPFCWLDSTLLASQQKGPAPGFAIRRDLTDAAAVMTPKVNRVAPDGHRHEPSTTSAYKLCGPTYRLEMNFSGRAMSPPNLKSKHACD